MINVSVIIPCYNVAPYVRKCLDSVLNQTLQNIEIIVVDDQSTDNTLNILHQMQLCHDCIKLIELKRNMGVSYARNQGLKIASGQYVSFVDPDDYIDFDFLEKLYVKGVKMNADIVKGYATSVKNIIPYIVINKLFFYSQWWSAIYKLDFLKSNKIDFMEDVFCGQDFVFQRHACLCANMVSVIEDESYYHYCRRKNSLDSSYFPLYKIESQLRSRKYILSLANKFCTNRDDYVIIIKRLFAEIEWLWNKTDDMKSHYRICEEYLYLYSQLLYKNILSELFPSLDKCMRLNDVFVLYNHLKVYKSLYKYCF